MQAGGTGLGASSAAAMKVGLAVPIFDALADPRVLAELAVEAEQAGWDGFFVWDHVYYRAPATAASDPWIALAAIADRTSTIAIGPMVTPLARRRPHVVARQVAALDLLSDGRVVFGVGLGLDRSGEEYTRFGEGTDVGERRAAYDEALGLVVDLLSGEPVDHAGAHYTARDVRFLPRPVQPSVPIWVAARWPNRRPLARAARHDGVVVIEAGPAEIAEVRAELDGPLDAAGRVDVVAMTDDDWQDPQPWAAAGASWLLASFDAFTTDAGVVRDAIARRP